MAISMSKMPLQTVGTVIATQTVQFVATSDVEIGGISHTITPLGANSKFLVTVRWIGECSAGWDAVFNIQMDGVRVNINGQGRGFGLGMPTLTYHNNFNSTPETLSISTLVNTSSVIGTPITFRLVADANSGVTMCTNRCTLTVSAAYERGTSEIIITEIGT